MVLTIIFFIYCHVLVVICPCLSYLHPPVLHTGQLLSQYIASYHSTHVQVPYCLFGPHTHFADGAPGSGAGPGLPVTEALQPTFKRAILFSSASCIGILNNNIPLKSKNGL